MAFARAFHRRRLRKAFSRIEISQTFVIVAILAAFVGLPQLILRDEREKASEAFRYFASLREAQERYHAKEGTFAGKIDLLDMPQQPPAYFSVGEIRPVGAGDLKNNWSITLTRLGGRDGGYGSYHVTFTHLGLDPSNSNIPVELIQQDW